MKKVSLLFILTIVLSLSSCAIVGDIFKAGMWTAFIIIAIIVGLIIWLISKTRGPRS